MFLLNKLSHREMSRKGDRRHPLFELLAALLVATATTKEEFYADYAEEYPGKDAAKAWRVQQRLMEKSLRKFDKLAARQEYAPFASTLQKFRETLDPLPLRAYYQKVLPQIIKECKG